MDDIEIKLASKVTNDYRCPKCRNFDGNINCSKGFILSRNRSNEVHVSFGSVVKKGCFSFARRVE